jgi:hypothetical protein
MAKEIKGEENLAAKGVGAEATLVGSSLGAKQPVPPQTAASRRLPPAPTRAAEAADARSRTQAASTERAICCAEEYADPGRVSEVRPAQHLWPQRTLPTSVSWGTTRAHARRTRQKGERRLGVACATEGACGVSVVLRTRHAPPPHLVSTGGGTASGGSEAYSRWRVNDEASSGGLRPTGGAPARVRAPTRKTEPVSTGAPQWQRAAAAPRARAPPPRAPDTRGHA